MIQNEFASEIYCQIEYGYYKTISELKIIQSNLYTFSFRVKVKREEFGRANITVE